jgi:DNA end-binding protein Ku
VDLRPQERAMAESLVESMSGDFEPEQYTDQYRAALQQVIDAKIEGRQLVEPETAAPTGGNVVDLMAALRASVDAAKRNRGEAGADNAAEVAEPKAAAAKASRRTAAEASSGPAASRTSSTRKAPAAKKTSAKKAPAAKKTATKKVTATKAAAKAAPARRRTA